MDCSLCQPLDDDEVWSGPHWRVIVNRNQTTLGKVFVVLNRHETDIVNLTDDEVLALWTAIRSVKDVLVSRFQPDHFNYAFLMNQDPHVHLHVIPRYNSPRDFAGRTFEDGDVLPQRPLSPEVYQEIVSAIREGFTGNYI
jgi:diadenosine tetraphosphate (Ap4A) HIT family hydrolase